MGRTASEKVFIMIDLETLSADRVIEKLYRLMIPFFILGCSVFFVPGKQFYNAQEVFFQYGSIAMIIVSMMVSRKRTFRNPLFILFGAYVLINTLAVFSNIGRLGLLNFFLGFILIREFIEKQSLDLSSVTNMLFNYSLVNIIFICLQIIKIDPVFSSANPQNMIEVDICGMMALKSNLGILAAFSLPFFLINRKFLYAISCLPLLYFGKSSAAVMACLVTALVFIWSEGKKKLFFSLIFIFALICGSYVYFYDAPTGEITKRFNVWFAGIHYLVGSNPWFGHGLGGWQSINFATIQNNGIPERWLWAHNEFIQVAFELGIAGFFCLFFYLGNLITRSIKYSFESLVILTPIILISFFHFPWHLGRFAGLLCFMISTCEAFCISNQKELES